MQLRSFHMLLLKLYWIPWNEFWLKLRIWFHLNRSSNHHTVNYALITINKGHLLTCLHKGYEDSCRLIGLKYCHCYHHCNFRKHCASPFSLDRWLYAEHSCRTCHSCRELSIKTRNLHESRQWRYNNLHWHPHSCRHWTRCYNYYRDCNSNHNCLRSSCNCG